MGEPEEKTEDLNLSNMAGLVDGFSEPVRAATKQRLDYEFCTSNFSSWQEFREHKIRNGEPLERAVIMDWQPNGTADLVFYERLRVSMARRSVGLLMVLEDIALDLKTSAAQRISAADKYLRIALRPPRELLPDDLPLTTVPALAAEAATHKEHEVQELTELMMAMAKRGMSCEQILGALRRGAEKANPGAAGQGPEPGVQGAGGE